MEAMDRAERLRSVIEALNDFPILRGVTPRFDDVSSGDFQRSTEYRELFRLIRQFLLANAMTYEGDTFSAVAKLTWRLFEQWCFIRVVDAFRAAGVALREWSDTLRQNLASRFILDFDRGLQFEGQVATALRLRIRYEPWILGEHSATQAGETLYRASSTNVAWSPDIVIELLHESASGLEPLYVVVMDCKYHRGIRDYDWTDTRKYGQIRSLRTGRQVVKQLWIIGLGGSNALTSTDPAVTFDDNGPSCPGDELASFEMEVEPGALRSESDDVRSGDPFMRFASGTLSFLRREIIATTSLRRLDP